MNFNDEEFQEKVQKSIGYDFDNIDLLYQAFTRKSYSDQYGGESNEVLEHIGDSVLSFFVEKLLVDRYGYNTSMLDGFDEEDADQFAMNEYETEGKISKLKGKLVSKKMLAHRIDVMGFSKYIFLGDSDLKNSEVDVRETPSVKEDVFESILGAIAYDSNWNYDKLQNSVELMLNIEHYLTNGFTDENDWVSLIQQWCQKVNKYTPEYTYEDNNRLFYRTPRLEGKLIATLKLDTKRGKMNYYGGGDSKAEARINAAQAAYEDIEENNELRTIQDEIPEKITPDNSIKTLKELADKRYCSIPQYIEQDEEEYDKDGNPVWHCTCIIESWAIEESVHSGSKKGAKRYAAYLVLCNYFGLIDEYGESEYNE